MDWTTEQLLLAQSPNAASAMQSLVTWLDGMPLSGPLPGPSVDPMASLPQTPVLTQSNAPPGVTVIDGMPIQGYTSQTVDPMPTLQGPTVDPMANVQPATLTLNDQGMFVPIVSPSPAPAMLAAPIVPATTMPSMTPNTDTVPAVLFGDHGGGGN